MDSQECGDVGIIRPSVVLLLLASGTSQRPALCAGRMHSFSKEACSNSFDVDSNDASVCSLRALLPQAHVSRGSLQKIDPSEVPHFLCHIRIPTAVALRITKERKILLLSNSNRS